MGFEEQVTEIARKSRKCASVLRSLSSADKDAVLTAVADEIMERAEEVKIENAKDLEAGREAGLSGALLDRLELTDKRIADMAKGVMEIVALPDPVGEVLKMWRRPNGMQVGRMRVPLGVIAIIFESRPNVTIDAAALCFKAGNAAILRGGSEAKFSNEILTGIFRDACEKCGVSPDAVTTLGTTDRQAVNAMLKLDKYIDVVIPRGGKGLIRAVVENSTIPVIKHYEGICHLYVDSEADLDMAQRLTVNAKIQRPGTCNALETLLVHQDVAAVFLPSVCEALKEASVEIRGCRRTQALCPEVKEAVEEDWSTEYLDLILSVKVVDNFDQAVDHIETYGSHHTDTIVTRDWATAQDFLQKVDSSSVMVNVSTRFSDGFQYGLGAEIGISTDKLHARGPMGLEELTTLKFIVLGNGQERQ